MKTILSVLLLAGMAFGADETAPASPVEKAKPSSEAPKRSARIKYVLLSRELLLDRYDTNRDGTLGEDEKKALLDDSAAIRKEFREKLIRRFDKDGDGKLSKEESGEMRTFLKKTRRERRSPRRLTPMPPPPVFMRMQSLIMERYDANGNGRIDREESDKIKKDSEDLYNRKVAELLTKYDANGDGKLDDAEKEVARSGGKTEEPKFDEIDAFIENSFEEELLQMLEDGDKADS